MPSQPQPVPTPSNSFEIVTAVVVLVAGSAVCLGAVLWSLQLLALTLAG